MLRRFLPAIVLAIAGLLLAAKLVPAEQRAVTEHLATFPDAHVTAQRLRPIVLGALCLLPALGGLFYAFCGTMARYAMRQFLALLGITFGALLAIWLLADLQDNLDEFKNYTDLGPTLAKLYGTLLPEIFITLIPYALLLSLLFCLGRLSSSREIIAMIQTGRGLARITLPFLVVGLLTTLFCLGLNYHWAPGARAAEKRIRDGAKGIEETVAKAVSFHNSRQPRHWMVRAFPVGFEHGAPLQGIRVIEEDGNGKLKNSLTADTATWDRATGTWSFSKPVLARLADDTPPRYASDLPDPLVVTGWRETPPEIIQPGLSPDELGIPALASRLARPVKNGRASNAFLTQWHNRFAQPFNCLVVVVLATPLGVVFSRRGASGGVALAVFLSVGLLFLGTICLSLGDSGYLPPILAAWLPNLLFGLLAFYLFRRRLSGRPIYQTIRRLLPNES